MFLRKKFVTFMVQMLCQNQWPANGTFASDCVLVGKSLINSKKFSKTNRKVEMLRYGIVAEINVD